MKTKTHITAVMFVASLLLLPCHAQEKVPVKDPYKKGNGAEPSPEQAVIDTDAPVNISIRYEAFSLPLAKAAAMQRENLSDGDLYSRLVAATEGDGVKQESLLVLTARNGQKAMAEGISEQIYASEYSLPSMPNTVGVAILPDAGEKVPDSVPDTAKLKDAAPLETFGSLIQRSIPTAFETRNVGVTLEIEPTLGEDLKYVDLRLVPSHITLAGSSAFGHWDGAIEMPVFETQVLNTSATVAVGRPYFLGTMSRPPASKVDPDSANRVWFAFVTASLKKP